MTKIEPPDLGHFYRSQGVLRDLKLDSGATQFTKNRTVNKEQGTGNRAKHGTRNKKQRTRNSSCAIQTRRGGKDDLPGKGWPTLLPATIAARFQEP